MISWSTPASPPSPLGPANPALIESIAVDLDDDGSGRETLYAHQPGAGPKMIFDPGGGSVVLDTTSPARVTVDPGGFTIVEDGPVKVVVELRGHFSAPGGASLCNAITPAYERGYTAVMTFVHARRDVHLQYHFRNECSDAFDQDWMDDAIPVEQASWSIPLDAGMAGTTTTYHGGGGAIGASSPGFAGLTLVEQRKGAGNPWQRQSRVRRDGATIESGEFFDQPFVALADAAFVAAAQMPWMRYREPQALAVDGKTLSLRPISEELVIGEAKGIWSFARLSFSPTQLASTRSAAVRGGIETFLEEVHDRGQGELERGLLVRAPLDHFNASGVYAGIGSGNPSPIATYYANTIDYVHEQNVGPGGQCDIAKTFGSQLWPDVQFDFFFPDWGEPANNPVATNYWNASGAELFEFLRTGDPKSGCGSSLSPRAGSRPSPPTSTSVSAATATATASASPAPATARATGTATAFNSSDDYNYNYGLQLAYAVRPNAVVRDRFAQVGRTVIERYDSPQEEEEDRDPFVNAVDLGRSAIQHFEHLAKCAEFIGGQRGADCQAKLLEILAELAEDNASSGVLCGEDIPAGNSCSTPPSS